MMYLKSVLLFMLGLFLFSLTASGVRVARLSGSAAPSKTLRVYLGVNNGNDTSMIVCGTNRHNLWGCKKIGHMGIKSFGDLAFNPANNLAYLADKSNKKITICSINSTDGTFFGCRPGNDYLYLDPRSIAFNAAGTLAYVASSCTNQVSVCSVSPDTGMLENCILSYIPGAYRLESIVVSPKGTMVYGGFNFDRWKPRLFECRTDPKTKELRDCKIYSPVTWNSKDYVNHIRFNGQTGFFFLESGGLKAKYLAFHINPSSEEITSISDIDTRSTDALVDVDFSEDSKLTFMIGRLYSKYYVRICDTGTSYTVFHCTEHSISKYNYLQLHAS